MVIMKSFAYILYFALIGISNCHELTGKKKEVAYSGKSNIIINWLVMYLL